MPSWKPFGGALSKRPHIGSKQLKYQYDVTVHSLDVEAPSLPTGTLSVLWTRGSKTAITSERSLDGNGATFDQPLTLICTLFREASSSGAAQFAEKLCTFAVIEQGPRGARTVAKCKVDISPFAEVSGGPVSRAIATSLPHQGRVMSPHRTPRSSCGSR